MIKKIAISLVCLFAFLSCEKEIEIKLPNSSQKLVVEGRIEMGAPPFVLLTRSISFFEPADFASIEKQLVHNANVSITVDGKTQQLEEVCIDELPPQFQELVAGFLGLEPEEIGNINYCVYTVSFQDFFTGNAVIGKEGKSYELTIVDSGQVYTSTTSIPPAIPLDSVWFDTEGNDSLGFAYAHLTDPDTIGNAYRWFAQRINKGIDGEPKDANFIAPLGSPFSDKFINGKSFDFGYQRGSGGQPSEAGDVPGFFKLGDTIVVKFTTIDLQHFEFLRSFETEVANNGNPFAAPSSVQSNIPGALGIWGGYGISYDTIIATK